MSPPSNQHPNMWSPDTQPLFSLANVISMAMSMAQSFIPPASLSTQGMPSFPGFHLPTHMAQQSGYHSVYPQQYQTTPAEVPYPTPGMQAQNNIYHSPENTLHIDGSGFPQSKPPSWSQAVSPLSIPSTPPRAPQEPLQQVSSLTNLTQEDSLHSYVTPFSAQVSAQATYTSEISSSNSSSDLSSSPPETPENTVSPRQDLYQLRFYTSMLCVSK